MRCCFGHNDILVDVVPGGVAVAAKPQEVGRAELDLDVVDEAVLNQVCLTVPASGLIVAVVKIAVDNTINLAT